MPFDAKEYGRLLNGLRRRRGFKSGEEFARLITQMGTSMNEDMLWAIERGERMATAERHLAFVLALKPLPGYFEEAYDVPEEAEISGQ